MKDQVCRFGASVLATALGSSLIIAFLGAVLSVLGFVGWCLSKAMGEENVGLGLAGVMVLIFLGLVLRGGYTIAHEDQWDAKLYYKCKKFWRINGHSPR